MILLTLRLVLVFATTTPACETSWWENEGYPHADGPWVYVCGDAEGNPR